MDFKLSASTNASPRRSYSMQFLMSFAGIDACRSPPPNFDLREINLEVSVAEEAPEWRRRSSSLGSPTGKNGHRKKNRLRSQSLNLEEYNSVVTFPTKNRVMRTSGDSSTKFEASQHITQEPKGGNYLRVDCGRTLTPLEAANHDQSNCIDNNLAADVKQHYPTSARKLEFGASSDETSSCDQSPSNQKIDLGSLFVLEKTRVLPMPAAPTLEEIEKEIKLTDDKWKLMTAESVLTCQDVEKSILVSNETSPGSTPTTVHREVPIHKREWIENEDKVASEHILSLLQRKPSSSSGDVGESFQAAGKAAERDLFGELICRAPISRDLANLDDVLKRYETIAAADFEQAKLDIEETSLERRYNSLAIVADTIDSVRTSVKQAIDHDPGRNEQKLASPRTLESDRSPKLSIGLWQTMSPLQQQQQQQQQQWIKLPTIIRPGFSTPPNTFLHTRPVATAIGETPLVPQALHALQRLVDHQLHILNSIPGEVTPGMLHQRLSRSVLGYPATGTHLLLATPGLGVAPAAATFIPFSRFV